MCPVRRVIVVFVFMCVGLSACGAPQNLPLPAGEGGGEGIAPTATLQPAASSTPPPTSTLPPTPEPTATANPEDAYYQSLTPEQQALFDQTKDMTGEGFTRQFLAEQGLTSYLAYYDTDGEVAFVWNFEQGKPNPALKIENNLLINETSGSHIIWNPELNRAEAQKTLADYFRYARARVIAGANHVELGNTLESALANPLAQKYLDNKHIATLNKSSSTSSSHTYDVESLSISVEKGTNIIFKKVLEPQENMVFITNGQDESKFFGWSVTLNTDSNLEINYFSQGSADFQNISDKDKLLTVQLTYAMQSIFTRAEKISNGVGDRDLVTAGVLFDFKNFNRNSPLIIFSKTR